MYLSALKCLHDPTCTSWTQTSMDCMPLLPFHTCDILPYCKRSLSHSPTIFSGRSTARNGSWFLWSSRIQLRWLTCVCTMALVVNWEECVRFSPQCSASFGISRDLQGKYVVQMAVFKPPLYPWEALPQLATTAWSFHASPSRGGHELARKSNKTHQDAK